MHKPESRDPVQRPQVRWVPPPEASYSANFDAAVFQGSGSAGISVVCRDHTGSIIAALSQKNWLMSIN